MNKKLKVYHEMMNQKKPVAEVKWHGLTGKQLFAANVANMLSSRSMTQSDLASATDVSAKYVNHLMNGRKTPSPEWVEIIANTLNASPQERTDLHRSAAMAKGYKIK